MSVSYGRNITTSGSGLLVDGLIFQNGTVGQVKANFDFTSITSSSSTAHVLNLQSPQTQTITGASNQILLLPTSTEVVNGLKYTIKNSTLLGIVSVSTSTKTVVTSPASLPATTIDVNSALAFAPGPGVIYVQTTLGIETINYTSLTPISFTGCSGGSGSIIVGGEVSQTKTSISSIGPGNDSVFTCIDVSGISGIDGWVVSNSVVPVFDANATPTYPVNLKKGVWYGLNTKSGAFDSTTITLGNNASTGGSNQIAIGTGATTSGTASHIAIGPGATVTGNSAVNDYHGIAVGRNATALGDPTGGSIAFGTNANAMGLGGSISVGNNSQSADFGTSIGSGIGGSGSGANAGTKAVSIGYQSTAGNFCVTVGSGGTSAANSVAFGFQSSAITNSVAIGPNAFAQSSSLSIGTNASSSNNSVAIGAYSKADTIPNSIAIGSVTTTISALSDAIVLPSETINVVSTSAFAERGSLLVTSSSGVQIITYNSVSGTSFGGCSGGIGTLSTGGLVAQFTEPADAAHAMAFGLNSASVAPNRLSMNGKQLELYSKLFETQAPSDPIIVLTASSPKMISFNGVSGNQTYLLPPSMSLANGFNFTFINLSPSFSVFLTSSRSARIGVANTLPSSIITMTDTLAAFQASGTIYVNDQTVSYTNITNSSATIAVASNGVALPSTTINVSSSAAFLSAGTVLVTTNKGVYPVTYTSKMSALTLDGCSGGDGIMSTGALVTQYAFTGCSGGAGAVDVGDTVSQSVQAVTTVLPTNETRVTCVDVSGVSGIDGWFAYELKSSNTQPVSNVILTMPFTIMPNNYSASQLAIPVNGLYRTDVSLPIPTVVTSAANGQATGTVFQRFGETFALTAGTVTLPTSTIFLQSNAMTGTSGYLYTPVSTGNLTTFSIQGSISPMNILTITSTSGVIVPGSILFGGGVASFGSELTVVVGQISGTMGGIGTYNVNQGANLSPTSVIGTIDPITYASTSSFATTIAALSNGVNLGSNPGVINVANSTSFPASGILLVATSLGVQIVNYTSKGSGTTFNGVTGGNGVMSTGDTVNQFTLDGVVGGVGLITQGSYVSRTRVNNATPVGSFLNASSSQIVSQSSCFSEGLGQYQIDVQTNTNVSSVVYSLDNPEILCIRTA